MDLPSNSLVNSVEKDFKELQSELKGFKELDFYLEEFGSIFEQLKKSQDSKVRLTRRCRELKAEYISNDARMPLVEKFLSSDSSPADTNTYITELKNECDQALLEVLKAKSHEDERNQYLLNLRKEVQDFAQRMGDNVLAVHASQPALEKKLEEKHALQEQLSTELETITKLRDTLQQTHQKRDELEKERQKMTEDNEELEREKLIKTEDSEVMRAKQQRLVNTIDQLTQSVENQTDDINVKQREYSDIKNSISRLNKEITEKAILKDRYSHDIDILSTKIYAIKDQNLLQNEKNHNLHMELNAKTRTLKEIKEDISTLNAQINKVEQVSAVLKSKLLAKDEDKGKIDFEKKLQKEKVLALEKRRQEEHGKMQKLRRELKKLSINDRKIKHDLNLEKKKTEEKQLKSELLTVEMKILKDLINEYKEQFKIKSEENCKIDNERLDYMEKSAKFQADFLKILDKEREYSDRIIDLRKDLMRKETNEKRSQNMYDAVQNDINLYNRSLLEIRNDLSLMKEDTKTKVIEVGQLKNEISMIEEEIKVEENEAIFLEKGNRALKEKRKELGGYKVNDTNKDIVESPPDGVIENIKRICRDQEEETTRLHHIFGELQFEKNKEMIELEKEVSRTNAVSRQIMAREAELKDLYETLKLKQAIGRRGESLYHETRGKLRKIKTELQQAMCDKNLYEKKTAGIQKIRNQVEHFRRELIKARYHCRVIQDEVNVPINIHRWRHLQGSDPTLYELIEKIQDLQKRYLGISAEINDKELLLKEREVLYVELKHILAKQPGPEVSEQLILYESVFKEKSKQIKQINEECRQLYLQEKEYKKDLENLEKEIRSVRKKFLIQKEKDLKNYEKFSKTKTGTRSSSHTVAFADKTEKFQKEGMPDDAHRTGTPIEDDSQIQEHQSSTPPQNEFDENKDDIPINEIETIPEEDTEQASP